MKLLLTTSLTLLSILPALCWPTNDGYMNRQSYDYYYQPEKDTAYMVEQQPGQYTQEQHDPFYYAQYQGTTDEPPLPKKAADELRRQLQAGGGDTETGVKVQSKSNGRVLRSGSTIGLQLNQNNFWLCCFAQTCYGGACPGKFFEGNERRRCYGEVFRIYRARGPGHIVNGDFVGIYYVAQRTWFSMYRGKGGKSSCPGIATAAHGFADLSKWFLCGAEVFQIFAKGKQMGERITDQDDVALYTPCALQTVHFTQPRMTFSKCMMKATNHAFPINDAAFDKCPFESVEITIFD